MVARRAETAIRRALRAEYVPRRGGIKKHEYPKLKESATDCTDCTNFE
jgi:hypothetical protein